MSFVDEKYSFFQRERHCIWLEALLDDVPRLRIRVVGRMDGRLEGKEELWWNQLKVVLDVVSSGYVPFGFQ